MSKLCYDCMLKTTALLCIMLSLFNGVQAQITFSPERNISDEVDRIRGIHFADIDGDGDLDPVCGAYEGKTVSWIENNLEEGFGERHIITTDADGCEGVFSADLDGDGDFDILSASRLDDKIAWYKNLGGGTFGPQKVLSDDCDGAIDVRAVDLDGDGDLDILACSIWDNSIWWIKNYGFGFFSGLKLISDQAVKARSVFAADLDGDGDNDVLSASRGDHTIAAYENLGAGSFGPRVIIDDGMHGARWVIAADLDGDGDQDIIGAAYDDDRVRWYKNDGTGTFDAGESITNRADGVRGLDAVDLDGDGDLDILTASEFDFRVIWFENQGGGSFGGEQVLSNLAKGAKTVYAADFNNDGSPDVLANAEYTDRLMWFENEMLEAPDFELIELAVGLNNPVDVDVTNDGKTYVSQRDGTIRPVGAFGALNDVLFLDISDRTLDEGPFTGLHAMVLDPNHDLNGKAYVLYNSNNNKVRISAFTTETGENHLDPDSEEILIQFHKNSNEACGGDMKFGGDGYLYISLGDQKDFDASSSPAGKLNSLMGKILRIDVSGPAGYSIPPDNPFFSWSGAQKEIWALGLHNARRLGFDRQGSQIYLADRGLLNNEIHIIDYNDNSGLNLGWPCYDGTAPISSSLCGPGSGSTLPVLQYPTSFPDAQLNISSSLYRGSQMSSLTKSFIFMDYYSGDMSAGDSMHNVTTYEQFYPFISSISENNDGEFLLTDEKQGKLLRMIQRCGKGIQTDGLDHIAENSSTAKLFWSPLPGVRRYFISGWQIPYSSTFVYTTTSGELLLENLPNGGTFVWKVNAICNDGSFTALSKLDTFTLPTLREYNSNDEVLKQQKDHNHPHFTINSPANSVCEINLIDKLQAATASLKIYAVDGAVIRDFHKINSWPLRINTTDIMPGFYFVEMRIGSDKSVKRLIIQH